MYLLCCTEIVMFVSGEDPDPPSPSASENHPPPPQFPYSDYSIPPHLVYHPLPPYAYGRPSVWANNGGLMGRMDPMMTMIMMMSLMSDSGSNMDMMLPLVMMLQRQPGADSNLPLMMMLLLGEDGMDKNKMLPIVVMMMSQAGDNVGANNIRSMVNSANMFEASGHPRPQF